MLLPRIFSRSSAAPSKPAPPAKRRSFIGHILHNWVLPLAIVAAIMFPLRQSVADWNDVPSGSMHPTILEGDRIYVNLLAFGLRVPFTTTWLSHWDTPQRGDIVTLKSPADGIRLVKRVIGLPGDHISMSGNQLVINGKSVGYSIIERDRPTKLPDGRWATITLQEEELDSGAADDDGVATGEVRSHALAFVDGALSKSSFKEMVVPDGQYFVMGDNRDLSRDSRMIGCVPLENIYGRSSYIALSVDPDNNYMPRFGRWFSSLK